jgi:hypothetical protein
VKKIYGLAGGKMCWSFVAQGQGLGSEIAKHFGCWQVEY